MTTVFEKGTSVLFAEIEQDDTNRRFLFPSEIDGLEERIRRLIAKYPTLSLVRYGTAIVTSEDETHIRTTDGLEGIPSTVETSYQVDLCGHNPFIQYGSARYSNELLKEVWTVEPPLQQAQVASTSLSASSVTLESAQLPKPDLAHALRHQKEMKEKEESQSLQDKLAQSLSKQKEKPKVELVVVPEKPKQEAIVVATQDTSQSELDEAIEKRSKQADLNVKFSPKPMGKLDILLERISQLEDLLGDALSSNMTGDDLKAWFWEHHDQYGDDKTFAILASRLKK